MSRTERQARRVAVTPVLRLQRGHDAAGEVADRLGVPRASAIAIVEAAFAEIEQGAERVGWQCAGCGRLLPQGDACPDHDIDPSSQFPPPPWASASQNRLLVAYDKVASATAPRSGEGELSV